MEDLELDEAADAVSLGSGLTEPGASAKRPVTPLWIIGTFLTLAGLAGATAMLLKPRGQVLDPVETQASFFASVGAVSELGLELEDARRLPSGETMLVYRASSANEGGSPESLTFMEYPVSRAKSVLEDQFQKLRFDSGSKFGGGGGGRGRGRGGRGGRGGSGGGPPGGGDGDSKKPKLQDAGFLDWQGYSANYARLRHGISEPSAENGDPGGASEGDPEGDPEDGEGEEGAKKGGKSGAKLSAFYESVRVNLSVGGRCFIAYLRFPRGEAATRDAAERVLATFQPLD